MKRPKHPWSIIGEKEPFFGVLSDTQYKSTELTPEKIDAFYQSGQREIKDLIILCKKLWGEKLWVKQDTIKALDFGCGVGRHSLALAEIFSHVTAYDISPTMVAQAQERVREAKINNIVFQTELPTSLGFDWINSYIVFQHIHPKEGINLLKHLTALTNPGAVLTLHIPFWREPHLGPPSNPISIGSTSLTRFLARLGRRPSENLIQMHHYDLSAIMKVLNQAGFYDVHLKYNNQGGFHGAWIISKRSTKSD